jgi:carbon storage regulator CsrA
LRPIDEFFARLGMTSALPGIRFPSRRQQHPDRLSACPRAKECAMLVLTRKLQQQIKIGEEITVTILRVKGNTVRVGVQAPRDVRVIRGELPKNGEGASAAEATTEGQANEIVVTAEIDDPAGAPADEAIQSVAKATPRPLPAAAHLPLRRIHDRRGAGPLKQIIASCGMLAK